MCIYRLVLFTILLLPSLSISAQAAREAASSDSTNACALIAKAAANGTSLTAVDPATKQTVDSPSYASQIAACNRNAQMCAPTKKQLGSDAPPGLACMGQASLVRKCLLVATLLGQLACGETSAYEADEVTPERQGISSGPLPTSP